MIAIYSADRGLFLRPANAVETEAFWARQPDPRCKRGETTWARPVRLSETESANVYSGPGEWNGGAGF